MAMNANAAPAAAKFGMRVRLSAPRFAPPSSTGASLALVVAVESEGSWSAPEPCEGALACISSVGRPMAVSGAIRVPCPVLASRSPAGGGVPCASGLRVCGGASCARALRPAPACASPAPPRRRAASRASSSAQARAWRVPALFRMAGCRLAACGRASLSSGPGGARQVAPPRWWPGPGGGDEAARLKPATVNPTTSR